MNRGMTPSIISAASFVFFMSNFKEKIENFKKCLNPNDQYVLYVPDPSQKPVIQWLSIVAFSQNCF